VIFCEKGHFSIRLEGYCAMNQLLNAQKTSFAIIKGCYLK